MRRREWYMISATALILAESQSARAQDSTQSFPRVIRGTVTHVSSTAPVPYVSVISDGVLLGMADETGRFNVLIRHGGALKVGFRRVGFRPESLSIGGGTDTTLALQMAVAEQQLARIVVEAERIRSLETRGFYQRLADREKGMGSSIFVTPEEVRHRNAFRVTQHFEGRPGINVTRVCTAGVDVIMAGRRASPNAISSTQRCYGLIGPNSCIMTVYLDGVKLQPADPSRARQTNWRVPNEETVPLLDDLIQASSIVAVEIHPRAASLPAQYQPETTCGVALLWTR
jgi:hypothetical protein